MTVGTFRRGVSSVGPPLGLVPVIGTPSPVVDTGLGSAGAVNAPVVGVIGAGQLARMMQPAAIALGVRLRVLAANRDESASGIRQRSQRRIVVLR